MFHSSARSLRLVSLASTAIALSCQGQPDSQQTGAEQTAQRRSPNRDSSATALGEPSKAAERRTAPEAAPEEIRRAQQALSQLKGQLKLTLSESMKSGGPSAAIHACKLKAPTLTASAATTGVVVGRSALRLRNPANQPPQWVRPLMNRLYEGDPANYLSVELEGSIGYVEPIVTAPLCLSCHGAELTPEVQATLSAAYPEDRATGFKLGEFRGVFWAEVVSVKSR